MTWNTSISPKKNEYKLSKLTLICFKDMIGTTNIGLPMIFAHQTCCPCHQRWLIKLMPLRDEWQRRKIPCENNGGVPKLDLVCNQKDYWTPSSVSETTIAEEVAT